jgi:hypothetical protein
MNIKLSTPVKNSIAVLKHLHITFVVGHYQYFVSVHAESVFSNQLLKREPCESHGLTGNCKLGEWG